VGIVGGRIMVTSATIGKFWELLVAVPEGVVWLAFSLAVMVKVGSLGPAKAISGLPQEYVVVVKEQANVPAVLVKVPGP
jgi:hypothetical protein